MVLDPMVLCIADRRSKWRSSTAKQEMALIKWKKNGKTKT